MRLNVIAVIDSPETLSEIRSGVSGFDCFHAAQYVSELPNDLPEEFLFILHKSQFSRDDLAQKAISQIRRCNPLEEGRHDIDVHLHWIHKSWNRIRGVIVVSGGKIHPNLQQSIAAAMEALPIAAKRPICFATSSDLRCGLKQALASWPELIARDEEIQELINELCGHGHLEIALKCLSSLLPFGLYWSRNISESRDSLISAVQNADLTATPFELEYEIVQRLVYRVMNASKEDASNNQWKMNVARQQAWLDSQIVKGGEHWKSLRNSSVPTTFDKVLEVLANSSTYGDWEVCLMALRDCLLSER